MLSSMYRVPMSFLCFWRTARSASSRVGKVTKASPEGRPSMPCPISMPVGSSVKSGQKKLTTSATVAEYGNPRILTTTPWPAAALGSIMYMPPIGSKPPPIPIPAAPPPLPPLPPASFLFPYSLSATDDGNSSIYLPPMVWRCLVSNAFWADAALLNCTQASPVDRPSNCPPTCTPMVTSASEISPLSKKLAMSCAVALKGNPRRRTIPSSDPGAPAMARGPGIPPKLGAPPPRPVRRAISSLLLSKTSTYRRPIIFLLYVTAVRALSGSAKRTKASPEGLPGTSWQIATSVTARPLKN
mmetsp:Transcript_56587/g.150883  ORF Transcript_56587/g.150883 Transcript_56587/m.150883 type:complete len:299 (-) Transcript_56587:98-994(-)